MNGLSIGEPLLRFWRFEPRRLFEAGVEMLQKLADHIAECRRRASECEVLAKDGLDETVAAEYRAMAKHWTRLADSYEFNVGLERFLHDIHKTGWPLQLENIPKPPSYED